MITKVEFGHRLRRARLRKDLMQKEVAAHLGVTPNAVGNWEQGLCFPNTGLIDDICVFLRVSPTKLFEPDGGWPR